MGNEYTLTYDVNLMIKNAKKQITRLKQDMLKATQAPSLGAKHDMFSGVNIKASKEVNKVLGKMDNLRGRNAPMLREKLLGVAEGFNHVSKSAKTNTENIKKQVKSMNELKTGTLMNYLGVMFFGQALKRMGTMMMNSTIPLFMQLTEGQTEAGKALTTLNAAWTTLKFQMGSALAQALMPMIPTLVNIIDKIGDFVEKHPQIALIVIAMTALGTALAVIGQAVLGLGSLYKILGIGQLIGGTKGLNTFNGELDNTATKVKKFSGLKAFAAGGLMISIGMDVADFLTGKESLNKTLTDMGLKIAGMGVLYGNPWVITIGIGLMLLPAFYDGLKQMVKDMKEVMSVMNSETIKDAQKFQKEIKGLDEYLDKQRELGIAGANIIGAIKTGNVGGSTLPISYDALNDQFNIPSYSMPKSISEMAKAGELTLPPSLSSTPTNIQINIDNPIIQAENAKDFYDDMVYEATQYADTGEIDPLR